MTGEMGIEASTSFTTMYIRPAPQVAVLTLMRKTGAIGRFWHRRTGAVQDAASGLRRIYLLHTRLNKGMKEGRGPVGP